MDTAVTEYIRVPVGYRDYLVRIVKEKTQQLKSNTTYIDAREHESHIAFTNKLAIVLSNPRTETADLSLPRMGRPTQIDLVSKGEIIQSFEVK